MDGMDSKSRRSSPAGARTAFGELADLLLQSEMSGVLNWLLEGFAKLHKSGLQLTMTSEQQTRANVLLLASESPQAFVRSCLIKKKDGVMGVADLYEQ